MTTLLPGPLQKALQEVVSRANQRSANLQAILLSTMDGVPLGRVIAEGEEELNEQVLANIESVWAPAAKQLPLLGLDKVKCVTAIYNHGCLIHIYKASMVGICKAGASQLFFFLF